MKNPLFYENQIAFALQQASHGTPVAKVTRKMGSCEQTFYHWKKQYGGQGPSEFRRLRGLDEENLKLKHMVAGLSLDRHMLQEVLRKRIISLICAASWPA